MQPPVSEHWSAKLARVNQAFGELSVQLMGLVFAGRSQNVTHALPNRQRALKLPTFRTPLRSLLQTCLPEGTGACGRSFGLLLWWLGSRRRSSPGRQASA